MKILKLQLDGYKQFENFETNFLNENSTSQSNYKFIIGENGKGKTSLLEAIASIFSSTTIDQLPGFNFYIEYVLNEKNSSKAAHIFLTNINSKGEENNLKNKSSNEKISFGYVEGGVKQYMNDKYFSEYAHLHPKRIFTIASSPNNIFEDIVVYTPYNELKTKAQKVVENENLQSEPLIIHKMISDLLYNPKTINFNIDTYIYIFISLMFFDKTANGVKMMESINKNNFKAQSYSIEFNDKILNKYLSNTDSKSAAEQNFRENLKKFIDCYSRSKVYRVGDEEADTSVYYFQKKPKGFKHLFKSLDVCILLSIAHRIGLIKSAKVYLKDNKSEHLLTNNILSDGEWMWICKIGLMIISKEEVEGNFLYLFDEPDLFLNEKWIAKYIYSIKHYSEDDSSKLESESTHEVIITTHSTLMLTDALQDQVFILRNNPELKLKNITFSPFGADRNHIASKLNFNDKNIGNYSNNIINDISKEKDSRKIDEVLQEVGFGFERFKLERLKLEIDDKEGD
ncbi:hypothetical protein RCC94_15325 [Exiguobacterium acetylicum]|uniref:AAA family ATPase n=1 Tax=Exiguobacterium acetylicum TaxID=41170 RepID=UPI0027E140C2|nr:AAA family ATPase [Exiguobacterium acetylicum]MDQ6468869.1 hypothetical protein [Exiguobacterium acetylicum]